MAEIIWVHLCDYAFSDRSGKSSIIGEFDRIFAVKFPIKFAQLFVVLKIRLAQGERFTLETVIRAPDGHTIASSTVPEERMMLNPGSQNAVFNFGFYTLIFPEPGEYAVDIRVNGTTVHVLPLHAETIPPPTANLPPQTSPPPPEKKGSKTGKTPSSH
jgi:hypothetical protein